MPKTKRERTKIEYGIWNPKEMCYQYTRRKPSEKKLLRFYGARVYEYSNQLTIWLIPMESWERKI